MRVLEMCSRWNPQVRDALFFWMTVSLLFLNVPQAVRPPVFGGPFSSMLLFWPLAAGVAYSIACERRSHDVFVDWKPFLRWLALYWAVLALSSIHGALVFPYLDDVLQGSTENIHSVTFFMNFSQYFGLDVSKEQILRLWLITSPVKNALRDSLYTFGTAYLVYCWYHNDPAQGIRVMCKGVATGFVVIALFSLIELPYLLHSETATWLLKLVTPLMHSIRESNGWWPPLLWAYRARAMFAEPSFLGIHFGWAMPLFFLFYLHVKTLRARMACGVVLFLCGVELFLTLSRTAMGLFFIVLAVFLAGVFLARRTIAVRRALTVVLIVAASYVGAIQFWQLAMGTTMLETSQAYFEETVEKAATGTSGSSFTRYGVIGAELRMGRDHFLLGVGPRFQRAYMLDYLDESDIKGSREMQMWVEQQEEAGRMSQRIPDLCEYPHRFAETGAIGLFLFLIPTLFWLYVFFRRMWAERCACMTTLMLFAAFSTTIACATLSAPLVQAPAHYLLLGLGIAYAWKEQESLPRSREGCI